MSCKECEENLPLNQLFIGGLEIHLCDNCVWILQEKLLKKVPNPKIVFQEVAKELLEKTPECCRNSMRILKTKYVLEGTK